MVLVANNVHYICLSVLGTDFNVLGPLNISAGNIPGGSVAINFTEVMLVDDGVIEFDETFMLSLPNQDDVDYTIGAIPTINISLYNDDCEYCRDKISYPAII